MVRLNAELAPLYIETPCWDWHWIGGINDAGYGIWPRVKPGNGRRAHRVIYEALVGEIAAGLSLDHLCGNKACVNPLHLEPVENSENTRRHFARVTHCPQGHAYTEANTRLYRGKRHCRACERVRYLRRKAEGFYLALHAKRMAENYYLAESRRQRKEGNG